MHLAIAEKGWEKAVHEDRALAAGLNLHDGKVFNKGVADAHQQISNPNH